MFADDEPHANYGHTCRYLLYESTTGKFLEEMPARLPPVADARQAKTLKPFHEPLRVIENPNLFKPYWPVWHCPVIIPTIWMWTGMVVSV